MSERRLSRRGLLRSGVGIVAIGSAPGVAGARASAAAPQHDGWTPVVATWNLGLGAEFLSVARGDAETPVAERVGTLYRQVLDSQPRARMGAVAAALAREQPDVVGVQEAALVRRGPRSGGAVDDPDAETVAVDHLDALLSGLDGRGSPYRAVSVATNADLELPGRVDGEPADVRVTDRDVLLVREAGDVAVDEAGAGRYDASLTLPVGADRTVEVPRGYATARLDLRGRPLAAVTTHLEAGLDGIRRSQAEELASVAASLPSPTVVLGDLNSGPGGREPGTGTGTGEGTENADGSETRTDPGGSPTGAYGTLTTTFDDAADPDTWPGLSAHGPGTCCRPGSLRPPDAGGLSRRIDHVLIDGLRASGSRRLGVEPTSVEGAETAVWPSDHAGVLAELTPPSETPTETTTATRSDTATAASTTESGTSTATGASGFGPAAALLALGVATAASLRDRTGSDGP